jgi:hypothetical protein
MSVRAPRLAKAEATVQAAYQVENKTAHNGAVLFGQKDDKSGCK